MPPAPKIACRKCQKLIARTGIRRHEKKCGREEGTRFLCPECGKTYQDNQGLTSHIESKHSNKTHPCSVTGCDKVFDSNDQRRNHFDQHHTDKFRCKCGKNHASTQNLNKHILEMTKDGSIGHEPRIKKVISESGSKPPDPTNPYCGSKKQLCTTTRLRYGLPGGHQEYCSKHWDELPGLVDLYPLCKYVGCAIRAHAFIVTTVGQLNFCPKHMRQLVQEGLPDPEVNAKGPKDYSRKFIEEGCGTRATFDNFTYCGPHSPTGKSDDKRVCEIPGCETRPSVGYPGEQQRWCGKHGEEGMVSHGLCVEPGCDKRASYGVPDCKRTSCAGHMKAGYINLVATICAMACCSTTSGGLQAVFFHPDHEDETSEFFNKRICRFGRRVLIEDALMYNDVARVGSLMTHFQMDRVLTLNAQSAFRFACESRYHELLKDCVDIVFDAPVDNGPKVIGALRPDIFYKWCINGLNYGIHIEYDETSSHEDDTQRLQSIAENAECGDRVYVIRVYGGHDTKNPACTRVRMDNFEYFKVTGEGEDAASKVAEAVTERVHWIKDGLGPDDSRPSRKVV